MTDPTEIARVAAGLTRAQREAVEGAKRIFGALVIAGQPSARQALKRKGLTDGPFADRFTETGLAVRDHIMREKSGG